MTRRPTALAVLAAGLAAIAAGCDDGRERDARADLERARARINAEMDRIARESAAPTEVVIESAGDRPEDVVAVLASERGLAPETARALLLEGGAGEPPRSSPMPNAEAEALAEKLRGAGASVRLEAASPGAVQHPEASKP